MNVNKTMNIHSWTV